MNEYMQDIIIEVITEHKQLTEQMLIEALAYEATLTPDVSISFCQDVITAITVAGLTDCLDEALESKGTADYEAAIIARLCVAIHS